jgi:hypothetical protein
MRDIPDEILPKRVFFVLVSLRIKGIFRSIFVAIDRQLGRAPLTFVRYRLNSCNLGLSSMSWWSVQNNLPNVICAAALAVWPLLWVLR